jgi:putative membrane protein
MDVTLIAIVICTWVATGVFAGQRRQASPDQAFVKKAAVGGLAEVQLGQLAVERAASPEVKQFGQRMIDDHGKANRELMAMVEPKGLAVPTALDRKHRQVADRLAQQGTDPELKRWAATTLPTLEEHLTMARTLATPRR